MAVAWSDTNWCWLAGLCGGPLNYWCSSQLTPFQTSSFCAISCDSAALSANDGPWWKGDGGEASAEHQTTSNSLSQGKHTFIKQRQGRVEREQKATLTFMIKMVELMMNKERPNPLIYLHFRPTIIHTTWINQLRKHEHITVLIIKTRTIEHSLLKMNVINRALW